MRYWAKFVLEDSSPVIVSTSFCFHIKGVSAALTPPFLFSRGLSYRCLVIGSIILYYTDMCIHYKLRYTYEGKHKKTWFLFSKFGTPCLIFSYLELSILLLISLFLYDLIKFKSLNKMYGYVHFYYPFIYWWIYKLFPNPWNRNTAAVRMDAQVSL